MSARTKDSFTVLDTRTLTSKRSTGLATRPARFPAPLLPVELPIFGATASGTYQTNVPANVYNKNESDYWNAGTGTTPVWVRVDLGSPFQITKVDLLYNLAGDGRPGAFRIEGSNNDSTWTTLADYPAKPPSIAWTTLVVIDTTPYRYVRVYSYTGAGEWITLGEIVVTGIIPPAVSGPSGSAYSAAVLADNPVGYWRLDELAGQYMDSTTGTKHHGTVYGGLRGRTGRLDYGWQSGAANSRIVFGNSALFGGFTAMTVEIWFKSTDNGSEAPLFAARGFMSATGPNVFELNLKTGTVSFGFFGATYKQISSPLTYIDNQWHHAVAVYTGAGVYGYIDGALVVSTSWSGGALNSGSGAETQIGNRWDGVATVGTFDEAAIYNTGLSSARVLAHYQAAS